MLSDKENKAIEDCDNIFMCLDDAMSEESANDYRKSYIILKNLIEKQSKEIEEVKAEKEKYERIVKRALMYLVYIDDDTLKMCTRYDVNGIDILKILAEMFCENKNLKNNSKIYVDYDYFKENHKETIAECYYKCSELWQNKIFTKIKEIENECKKCRFKKSGICEELCQNSQCVQGECLKVLHSLSR